MIMDKDIRQRERKKIGRVIIKVVLIALAGIIAIMGGVLLYANVKHRKALKEEEQYLTPPGQMVEVNGHKIHVVHTGNENAKHTLVFIHGNRTADEAVALEPLFEQLSDYELIYVDRSGTGYSDDWDAPKDIDSMLEETREALKQVTDSESYILVASKSGGTEAFEWVHKYPEEVEAVIGIQMYFPDQYDGLDQNAYYSLKNKLALALVNIGAQRLADSVWPEDDKDIYSKDQMDRRTAIVARGLYTKGMCNEDKNMVINANKVAGYGWPEDVPIYAIYCNPYMDPYLHENENVLEVYEDQAADNSEDPADTYNSYYKEHFAEHDNVEFAELSGPDRLVVYNPQKLAEMMKGYINDKLE